MASDIVAQLADSLAKAGVEDGEEGGELSYKGQGRKLDDALSGEGQLSVSICCEQEHVIEIQSFTLKLISSHLFIFLNQ